MSMFYRMLFILLVLFFNKCDFFHLGKYNLGKRISKLHMKYKYGKDYYQYYRNYKSPLLQSPVDVYHFVKANEKQYLLYEKNKELIDNTNSLLSKKNATFQLDINEFADEIDFDIIESQNIMLNKIKPPPISGKNYKKIVNDPFNYIGDSMEPKRKGFSWNNTNFLSPVKNQGRCGSCWAFATTTSIETFMRKKNFTIERLSEQELVDCSEKNHGCNGGIMHEAMNYIIEKEGLATDEEYPYNASNSACKINTTRAFGSNISEYMFTIPKSIFDLKYSVQQNPVTIAIDANNVFFRFYKTGIIDVPRNESQELNHAVLLVGYDYDEKGLYWIIQNSWGEKWGMDGFCKVRAKENEGVLLSHLYGVYPSK